MRKQTKDLGDLSPLKIAMYISNRMKGAEIAIGPLVWQLSDGSSGKVWYFIVAYADKSGFCCNRIVAQDDLDRFNLISALGGLNHQRVVNIFDDEQQMVRFCEHVWPGNKTRKMRESQDRELEAARFGREQADLTDTAARDALNKLLSS